MADSHQLHRVAGEIERLHGYFVQWFSGSVDKDREAFDAAVTSRMAADFVLIPPGGKTLSREDICDSVYAGHAHNSDFRIAVRDVRLRRQVGDVLVVTYQEWQRAANNSTPPDNGRVSTALLCDRYGELEWLHVHETWLPADVIAAGDYSF